MPPDAESLREIAQAIDSTVPYRPTDRQIGDLARAYLDLTAPMTNPHPAVAAARKALEDAPHAKECDSRHTYHRFWLCSTNKSGLKCDICDEPENHYRHQQDNGMMPCNCWKSTSPLEALIALLSAAGARERTLREALKEARPIPHFLKALEKEMDSLPPCATNEDANLREAMRDQIDSAKHCAYKALAALAASPEAK